MKFEEASNIIKVLADDSRLKIVKILSENKKMCANDLLPSVDCKQATLSHHMSQLVEVELLSAKKSGNKVYYSLNKKSMEGLVKFLGDKLFVKTDSVAPVAEKAEEKQPEVKVEEKKEPVVKQEEHKGNPVNISVPIYLL